MVFLLNNYDTMGYGVNFTGAAIPRSVPGIIYGLHTHAGVPSSMIEWHGHNDFYKAVSEFNDRLALRRQWCQLLAVFMESAQAIRRLRRWCLNMPRLKGTLDGMDTSVITEAAEYFEKELGEPMPERTPFVGKNFNVTRAGVHADRAS